VSHPATRPRRRPRPRTLAFPPAAPAIAGQPWAAAPFHSNSQGPKGLKRPNRTHAPPARPRVPYFGDRYRNRAILSCGWMTLRVHSQYVIAMAYLGICHLYCCYCHRYRGAVLAPRGPRCRSGEAAITRRGRSALQDRRQIRRHRQVPPLSSIFTPSLLLPSASHPSHLALSIAHFPFCILHFAFCTLHFASCLVPTLTCPQGKPRGRPWSS